MIVTCSISCVLSTNVHYLIYCEAVFQHILQMRYRNVKQAKEVVGAWDVSSGLS